MAAIIYCQMVRTPWKVEVFEGFDGVEGFRGLKVLRGLAGLTVVI